MHQRKYMVGKTGRISVMFFYAHIGFVIKQSIQYIGSVTHANVNNLCMERNILVKDVCVELNARFASVFGLLIPPVLAWLPVLNRWPSEEDVVPSPQLAAKGGDTARSPILITHLRRYHL